MICQHCKNELSPEEIRALKSELMAEQGRKTSEAKKASSAKNGKLGGRPRKIQDTMDGTNKILEAKT